VAIKKAEVNRLQAVKVMDRKLVTVKVDKVLSKVRTKRIASVNSAPYRR
jgi:hypothetical protein